jgi:kumamolisin
MQLTRTPVSVRGSMRKQFPAARKVGPAMPDDRVLVTVLVRRRSPIHEFRTLVDRAASNRFRERRHLDREEFAAAHGAHPDDMRRIQDFAHEYGFDIVEAKPTQRRLLLSGTVAQVKVAFGVELATYEYPGGSYRGRIGEIKIPKDIATTVEAVLGLDNRPQSRPHFRMSERGAVRPFDLTPGSFTAIQVGQLYSFPTDINGAGQCIAIIEQGGGYNTSDLQAYFAGLGIPMPSVRSVSVDGADNQPAGDRDSREVTLDIEVAGSIAPAARIVVYFAPNGDAGFVDAVKAAIHDTANQPSVISISWGTAELHCTEQGMRAMDEAFKDAAVLGITVCCASGDNGSSDLAPDLNDSRLHVDFPSSSPFALACGGTLLQSSNIGIRKEVVWNEGPEYGASGGGISDFFDLPQWQAAERVPPSGNPSRRRGRGVPDVSGDAAGSSGYQVLVDGQWMVASGTSPVAPLWAGLIALLNQRLGRRMGYINPLLYRLPRASGAFNDILQGNNDVTGSAFYQAGRGWNPCTGLGSPNGVKLFASLSNL